MNTIINNKPKISINSTVVAGKGQVSSDLGGGEIAILNLNNGVYYGLNSVGARIWQLVQEPIGVNEIRDIILKEYEVNFEQCEGDILALLAKLASEGLIECINETSA